MFTPRDVPSAPDEAPSHDATAALLRGSYHPTCSTNCSSEALVAVASEAVAHDGVPSSCRGCSSARLQLMLCHVSSDAEPVT